MQKLIDFKSAAAPVSSTHKVYEEAGGSTLYTVHLYSIHDDWMPILFYIYTKQFTVHLYSMFSLFSAIDSAPIILVDGPKTT